MDKSIVKKLRSVSIVLHSDGSSTRKSVTPKIEKQKNDLKKGIPVWKHQAASMKKYIKIELENLSSTRIKEIKCEIKQKKRHWRDAE